MAWSINFARTRILGHGTSLRWALAAFLVPLLSYGTESSPPIWAASELIWPWERTGILWAAYSHRVDDSPGFPSTLKLGPRFSSAVESWPKTIGEICDGLSDASQASDPDHGVIQNLLMNICRDKSHSNPASLTVDAGAYPIDRRYPLSHPFESFGSGWGSVRIDPELAHTWTELPPVIKTELRYPVSPHSFVYFRLGLRRDLAAWHGDAYGLNLPLAAKEVDLNEPSLGYFHAENESFAFTVGRFQVHWSPSPDFGLALSHAVPYHNAAEFALKTPYVKYRFLISSLNPWLEGTPSGDSSGTDYPVGSEEYRQRHYPDRNQANNAHKRVYDDRIKTLIAHRLEAYLGPATMGITETEIIGGKVPDFRDGNPFAFFHNDFVTAQGT